MQFPLTDTKMLSSTTRAFVEKDKNLVNLIGIHHPYLNLEKAIEGKKNFNTEIRQALVDKLSRQYNDISKYDVVHENVFKNIDKLKKENTFTVTTGQQVHLFIGPAFVIFKVLSLIDHSESFKTLHADSDFVPVYWLASEDHDFEEIKSTRLFKGAYEWSTPHGGACGRLKTDSVKDIIAQITDSVDLDERQQGLLKAFGDIYDTSDSLSQATLRVMNKFFGEYGLLCLDADDRDLKSFFKPVMMADILERKNLRYFESISSQLESQGLSKQLHAREINFFYLGNNRRDRIVFSDGKYKVLDNDIEFTEEEISELIETHPEKISPNAVLRPIYQETILPNVAYIGGNAEINYWIQLCNIFTVNNITPPNLILRPSVWITPQKTTQWLDKLGIRATDLLITENPSELLKFIETDPSGLETWIERFESLRKEAQNIVAQNVSKELKAFVDAGKAYEKALKNADKSLKNHKMEKHSEAIDKLEDIRATYFNINNITERTTSALELLIKHENVVFKLKSNLELSNSLGHVISL